MLRRRRSCGHGTDPFLGTLGLVDGPGIRTVIFLQGCRLRCRYCHNPDTWELCGGGTLESPEETVNRLMRFKPYYGADGGVTFSGGEPLLQKEFLTEVLALCKSRGIHTCLDTAGVGCGGYGEILKNTDLVLLDVKHYTPEGYQAVTSRSMDAYEEFLDAVQSMEVPLWLRHVVVPGLTDGEDHLAGLAEYVKGIRNVKRDGAASISCSGGAQMTAPWESLSSGGRAAMESGALVQWQERMNCGLKNG